MPTIDKPRFLASMDGLSNVASGLAGNRDKSSYNRWGYTLNNDYVSLEAAYEDNWIASTIVDVPAEDACAKWRTIKCKAAEEIQRHEMDIGYKHVVQEALCWARLYGGGSVLMLTGQDLEKPLVPSKVKKGALAENGRLLVFDRFDLSGQYYNHLDPLAPNYLEPTYYTIRGGSQLVHCSHFARFKGKKLSKRRSQTTQGWGDSHLRRALGDIQETVAAKGGIAHLLQEANVDVFRAEDLWKSLSTSQDNAIITRYQNLNLMKSAIQAIVLDKNEEYDRKTLNLGGVEGVIEQFMVWIAASARMPVTKIFGTSAKGMSATGEGDLNNYYDTLKSIQQNDIDPSLRVLDEVLCRSATGSYPTDFDYEWNPLHQEDPLKAAQVRKLDSETHINYLDAGLITPPQIQRELQANEDYQFKDEDIEVLEEHYDDPLDMLDKPDASKEESAGLTDERESNESDTTK